MSACLRALGVALLLHAAPAHALLFETAFTTQTVHGITDPGGHLRGALGGLVSGGSGDVFFLQPVAFSGSWTVPDDAPDLDPDPFAGRFEPDAGRIALEVGGLDFGFDVTRVDYFHAPGPGPSLHRVEGWSASTALAAADLERIVIEWGQASPLVDFVDPARLTNAPAVPLPGSPWEDGSGSSHLTVSGFRDGAPVYELRSLLGRYRDPAVAVPEPSAFSVFALGALLTARRLRRRA